MGTRIETAPSSEHAIDQSATMRSVLEVALASAASARNVGDIPQAAGHIAKALAIAPRHIGALTEKIAFAMETKDDRSLAAAIHALCDQANDATTLLIGKAVTTLYNRAHPPTCLAIAAQPDFSAASWAHLSNVRSPENPDPFDLSRQTAFPLLTSSIELTYLSNSLSQFAEATREHIYREVKRVLHPSGYLLLKEARCALATIDVLRSALQQNGFMLVSNETEKILRRFSQIPSLAKATNDHMYYIAVKT